MHLRTATFSLDALLSPLTPVLPPSPLPHLPRPLSHFLGYRPPHSQTTKQPLGNVLVSMWALLGAFAGLLAVAGLFEADWITGRGGPIIVGSFGAAAVLEFNAIESPFSQPRNAILGQTIASLIGVAITKLFLLQPHPSISPTATPSLAFSATTTPAMAAMANQPPPYASLAAALAVGLSSMLMSLTGTIYPPAGATALLAATEPAIIGLGWLYIGVVVLGTVILLAVAMLVNNIMRRFPMYWWAPMKAHPDPPKKKNSSSASSSPSRSSTSTAATAQAQADPEKGLPEHDDDGEGQRRTTLTISAEKGIELPWHLRLSQEEWRILRILEGRIREVEGVDGVGGEQEEERGRRHHEHHFGQRHHFGHHHDQHDWNARNEDEKEEPRPQQVQGQGAQDAHRDASTSTAPGRGSVDTAHSEGGNGRLGRVDTFGSTSTLRDGGSVPRRSGGER